MEQQYKKPCPFFKLGLCNLGSSCKLSHDSSNGETPKPDYNEVLDGLELAEKNLQQVVLMQAAKPATKEESSLPKPFTEKILCPREALSLLTTVKSKSSNKVIAGSYSSAVKQLPKEDTLCEPRGNATSLRRPGQYKLFYCHSCGEDIPYLLKNLTCPSCYGDFVEERTTVEREGIKKEMFVSGKKYYCHDCKKDGLQARLDLTCPLCKGEFIEEQDEEEEEEEEEVLKSLLLNSPKAETGAISKTRQSTKSPPPGFVGWPRTNEMEASHSFDLLGPRENMNDFFKPPMEQTPQLSEENGFVQTFSKRQKKRRRNKLGQEEETNGVIASFSSDSTIPSILSDATVQSLLSDAKKAFENGQYRTVYDLMTSALGIEGHSVELRYQVYLLRAMSALRMGHTEDGERNATLALKLNSKESRAYVVRAKCHWEAGRQQEAVADALEAVMLNDNRLNKDNGNGHMWMEPLFKLPLDVNYVAPCGDARVENGQSYKL